MDDITKDHLAELTRKTNYLEDRVLALEDPDCTLTACARGAVEGTANLMEELVFLKHKQTQIEETLIEIWKILRTLVKK